MQKENNKKAYRKKNVKSVDLVSNERKEKRKYAQACKQTALEQRIVRKKKQKTGSWKSNRKEQKKKSFETTRTAYVVLYPILKDGHRKTMKNEQKKS